MNFRNVELKNDKMETLTQLIVKPKNVSMLLYHFISWSIMQMTFLWAKIFFRTGNKLKNETKQKICEHR